MVDELPAIYSLQNGDHLSEGVLDLAEKLLPSRGSFLMWGGDQEKPRVWARGELPALDFEGLMAEENWEEGDCSRRTAAWSAA